MLTGEEFHRAHLGNFDERDQLGFASAVETLDTYNHLWPDSDDRTRDAIDSVLGFAADALRMEAAPTS